MATFSITCIASDILRDECNAAMDAAGLPSGLTVPLRRVDGSTTSYYMQHVTGDEAVVAAYEAITGLHVHAVPQREHAKGAETADEHLATLGLTVDVDEPE